MWQRSGAQANKGAVHHSPQHLAAQQMKITVGTDNSVMTQSKKATSPAIPLATPQVAQPLFMAYAVATNQQKETPKTTGVASTSGFEGNWKMWENKYKSGTMGSSSAAVSGSMISRMNEAANKAAQIVRSNVGDLNMEDGNSQQSIMRGDPRKRALPGVGRRASESIPVSAQKKHKISQQFAPKQDAKRHRKAGAHGGLGWRVRSTTRLIQGRLSLDSPLRRWIRCEICSKWRRESNLLPVESMTSWKCSDNRVDKSRNSCTIPEQELLSDEVMIPEALLRQFEEADKEKFYKHLFDFRRSIGLPKKRNPVIGGKHLDLYRLYREVCYLGGYETVNIISITEPWMSKRKRAWQDIYMSLPNYDQRITNGPNRLKNCYEEYLLDYENAFYAASDPKSAEPPVNMPTSNVQSSIMQPSSVQANVQLQNIQPPKTPAHVDATNIMQGPPVPMPEFNPPPLIETLAATKKLQPPPPPPPPPLPTSAPIPARTSPPPPPPPPPVQTPVAASSSSRSEKTNVDEEMKKVEKDNATDSHEMNTDSHEMNTDAPKPCSNDDKQSRPMDTESASQKQATTATTNEDEKNMDVAHAGVVRNKSSGNDEVPKKTSGNDDVLKKVTDSNDSSPNNRVSVHGTPSNDVSEFLRDSDGENNNNDDADGTNDERKAHTGLGGESVAQQCSTQANELKDQ